MPTPPDVDPEWVMTTSTILPYLSHKGKGVISFRKKDLQCFQQDIWFSDVIMDFGLNFWMKQHLLSTQNHWKIWTFSTFFYTALRKKPAARIARWTKNVDIFTFDFIIIPVHLNHHWLAVIIVKPALVISTIPDDKRCYIISMDSISAPQCKVHSTVRRWLLREAQRKHPKAPCAEPECRAVKVPQQSNMNDCGPYTLHNISRFIRNSREIIDVLDVRGTLSDLRYYEIWREDQALNYRSVLRAEAETQYRLSNPASVLKVFPFECMLSGMVWSPTANTMLKSVGDAENGQTNQDRP